MGWRDIESLPTDGTSVLLSTEHEGTVIGWWHEYIFGSGHIRALASYAIMECCEGCVRGGDFDPFDAKKWMPLPLV